MLVNSVNIIAVILLSVVLHHPKHPIKAALRTINVRYSVSLLNKADSYGSNKCDVGSMLLLVKN